MEMWIALIAVACLALLGWIVAFALLKFVLDAIMEIWNGM